MTESEKLKTDLHNLTETVQRISSEVERTSAQCAKVAALEEIQKVERTIEDRFDKRTKTAIMFVGLLATLFGLFSYFGLPLILKSMLTAATVESIEDAKLRATKALTEINVALSEVRKNRLIVLQTDYGSKSSYMGTLKGVINGINPSARLETITSEINSFDVFDAAWTLTRASRFFPGGTIFVVITNPGGVTSNPVVIETKNDHVYVGYDNGCFDFVVQQYGLKSYHSIANPQLNPSEFKDLFGGNDLFGPTAAKLSLGFPIDSVGRMAGGYLSKLPTPSYHIDSAKIIGTVMDIDRYGNATTNIPRFDLQKLGIKLHSRITVSFGKGRMNMPFEITYGHASVGSMVAIPYDDLLQLAINEGNFAKETGVSRGVQVTVSQ